MIGPEAADTAVFAVPTSAFMRVCLLETAGDPTVGLDRSVAPADVSSRRLQDLGVQARWKMRRPQRGLLFYRSMPATQLLCFFFSSGGSSVEVQAVDPEMNLWT